MEPARGYYCLSRCIPFSRIHKVELISIILTTVNPKELYVKEVCQHRITKSIENQIKAYIDEFSELNLFSTINFQCERIGAPNI